MVEKEVAYFVCFYPPYDIRNVPNLFSVLSITYIHVHTCMEGNIVNVKRDHNSSKFGTKMSLSLAG
jgi:hypothetical protein